MKFLNISLFILVLFFTGALKAAAVITRPLTLLERIATLPLDCQLLILRSIPNPELYRKRAAALARREQRVQCMWAARTFN